MSDTDILIESWNRQAQIVLNVIDRLEPGDLDLKPAEGETPIAYHFCHIHSTRRFWLSKIDPKYLETSERLFEPDSDIPSKDRARIRVQLEISGQDVAAGFRQFVEKGTEDPSYEHPIHFLHHMIWHEGWHVGLIVLALRRAGKEPPEEWEEANIWGQFRTEVWP